MYFVKPSDALRRKYAKLNNEDCAYVTDNVGNKLEVESEEDFKPITKEKVPWSPKTNTFIRFVAFAKNNVSANCPFGCALRTGCTNTRGACVSTCYLGAREATICSKHGSPRSGSHHGISFNCP